LSHQELQPRSAGDQELIAAIGSGDRQAFLAFAERHQAAVFRHLRALCATKEDAEDALQETFFAVFRHASGFRGDSSAKTWLFTIARNAAWKTRRGAAMEPLDEAAESIQELGGSAGWGETDPESLAAKAQSRDRLRLALDSLPAEDREILILRELEGFSGEETASILSLGLPAMKSRLHRARLRLACALRKGGDR
jgi:RNA polymerase sigma-70 factor (ECF subfamily)